MADITMCQNVYCPIRKNCYRSPDSGTAPSGTRQAWSHFQYDRVIGHCGYYWPMEHKTQHADERRP